MGWKSSKIKYFWIYSSKNG